jgi:hypothetical protein
MLFDYPSQIHVRKHGPKGYRDAGSFKPWLRDEFAFRCVYCLWRETWCQDGDESFSVEHFAPRSTHPDQACEYDNLLYACCRCNSLKREVSLAFDPN